MPDNENEITEETESAEAYTARMLGEIHEQLLGVRELIGEVRGEIAMFAELGGTIREEEPTETEDEDEPIIDDMLLNPFGELDLDLD